MSFPKSLLISILLLALLGPLGVKVYDIPLTLQSIALMLSAYYCGGRATALGALIYLGLGATGLPVFAQFSGGWQKLAGPTAGFLWAFPVIGFLGGQWLRTVHSWPESFMRFLALHLVLLAIGITYIAVVYGGLNWGSTTLNLLPGAIFKSLAAALVTRFIPR